MERRVEGEQGDLVLLVKLRQHRIVCLAGHGDLGPDAHAPAHVDQDGQRDWRLPIGPEVHEGPDLTVVPDLEVRPRETLHDPPASIPDGRLYRHEIHRAPEDMLGCLGRLGAQPRHRDGHEDQDSHSEGSSRMRGHHWSSGCRFADVQNG